MELDKNTFGKGEMIEKFTELLNLYGTPKDVKRIHKFMSTLRTDYEIFCSVKKDTQYFKIMKNYYYNILDKKPLSNNNLNSHCKSLIATQLLNCFKHA